MYNFSFICRASKIDKKGFAPIELSIIINGTRTYVILPMKYEPTLFNKMMTSKKNNEVLEYTSSVRTKLNKCIAEMTANNILDERCREMYWENTRRSDLVRHDKFVGNNYVWSWKNNIQKGGAIGSHMNIFPVPSNVIAAQPEFGQNDGY